jgi:predicted DNA-binding transcriptional regulator YafY
MSRTGRLLDLIQTLRRHRRPVRGAQLADELDVSLRTIYRDIQTLIAQGAPIHGEAGIGYLLRPGFTLPPLMFTPDEIEALVLGSGMVRGPPTLHWQTRPTTHWQRSGPSSRQTEATRSRPRGSAQPLSNRP